MVTASSPVPVRRRRSAPCGLPASGLVAHRDDRAALPALRAAVYMLVWHEWVRGCQQFVGRSLPSTSALVALNFVSHFSILSATFPGHHDSGACPVIDILNRSIASVSQHGASQSPSSGSWSSQSLAAPLKVLSLCCLLELAGGAVLDHVLRRFRSAWQGRQVEPQPGPGFRGLHRRGLMLIAPCARTTSSTQVCFLSKTPVLFFPLLRFLSR